MKETRASIALLVFIIVLHIAHLLPQTSSTTEITLSYPATTCPGPISDAKATALLPSKSIAIREVSKPNADLRRNSLGSFTLNNGAILIDGNPSNTIGLQSRSGKWTAALTCALNDGTAWFVGGTANVTSQAKLVLINSGLSDAIVDVTSFSENGPTQTVPVTINPSSERVIRIDSLDPGADCIVLRVETRSGRVTSYLLDERVRGLNNVGGDFVAPLNQPAEELIIPALPIKFGSSSQVSHRLRIMTPGKVDASVNVEVISPEGVFIPVGFGDISLNPQEVNDVDLSEVDLGGKTFGLKVSSTEPIVAAVFTEVRSGSISDFMWSSASQSFGTVSFNLYGLEPTLSFVGERVLVDVTWRDNQGKSSSKSIRGEEIVNWKVPTGVRLMTIVNRSGALAGMSWISRDGVTHLSVVQSTNLESATKPIADVAVIQPRG